MNNKKKLIVWLYEHIKFNLGIKKYFSFKLNETKYLFNSKLAFPLYKKLEKHIFNEIVDHYGADYKWNDQKSQNLDKQSSNYGYGLFHYAMVRNQKPKKILCVGSMYGYIPYMLAKACEDNGFGKVDFVDAGYNLKEKVDESVHYFGQGFWKKESIDKHFSYLLDHKYIKSHIITSALFAKKYPKNHYDYIYLDGDHSYKGALLDFKLFWPKLNKDGFICFHDIHLEKGFLKKEAQDIDLEYGYKKIWKELVKKEKYKFELSNYYSGLGLLQKK